MNITSNKIAESQYSEDWSRHIKRKLYWKYTSNEQFIIKLAAYDLSTVFSLTSQKLLLNRWSEEEISWISN
jgi:hypothetical protein